MNKELQKNLRNQVAPYEKSNTMKSIWQLINSIVPFIFLWFLCFKSLSISYFLTLGLAVLAGGFLVRIFIIFHDCCHHSFFKNRRANKIVGTITGIITLFPYNRWQHEHSVHHATSSNLDKRGTGDLWMLTLDEYKAASFWKRLAYRLYRNPFIMFGVGPIYVFLLQNRFNRKAARLKERLNTYLTNISILALYWLLCWEIGWQSFLLVEGPIFLISGSIGIWLFYVQHTFEDSYFEEDAEWEYVKAAVEGSSYYKLPKLLQWLTGNIGYHHIHHLSPRVPNYKLEEVHNNTLPLQNVPTVTLTTSISSLKFHLWDEARKKFIGFKDVSN
ncbi:fatty acid desaturase [Neobacillus massiliamazoniensis]|jgi:omega-6 fatty acid desaturase (delta-12 desaturase)|uniref:Fatty acid desaturase n=1 Tax=Neobacillus massiliamazoniensis TaxID=1499688 RepID=A0A0U1NRP8_9BACI|nr:fatty acid desaturase [Neobacillus massiliamazoniensis]CRK80733.1 fatty acid desaturase [Neobacillus massiliamazoniensis]